MGITLHVGVSGGAVRQDPVVSGLAMVGFSREDRYRRGGYYGEEDDRLHCPWPASPSWTRLVIGDLGAGEAFSRGSVQVIEDTGDPGWSGVFRGSRVRSFASFPVCQRDQEVIAVVNVDADAPQVFTRDNAGKILYPIFLLPLNNLAEILYHTHDGALGSRTPGPQEEAR